VRPARPTPRHAAAEILAALRHAQKALSAGKPPEDDRTILIIQRL